MDELGQPGVAQPGRGVDQSWQRPDDAEERSGEPTDYAQLISSLRVPRADSGQDVHSWDALDGKTIEARIVPGPADRAASPGSTQPGSTQSGSTPSGFTAPGSTPPAAAYPAPVLPIAAHPVAAHAVTQPVDAASRPGRAEFRPGEHLVSDGRFATDDRASANGDLGTDRGLSTDRVLSPNAGLIPDGGTDPVSDADADSDVDPGGGPAAAGDFAERADDHEAGDPAGIAATDRIAPADRAAADRLAADGEHRTGRGPSTHEWLRDAINRRTAAHEANAAAAEAARVARIEPAGAAGPDTVDIDSEDEEYADVEPITVAATAHLYGAGTLAVNGNGHQHGGAPPLVPMTFRTVDRPVPAPRTPHAPVAEDRAYPGSFPDLPSDAGLVPPQRREAAGAGGLGPHDRDGSPPPPGLVPLLPHRIPAPPDVPDVPDDLDEPETTPGVGVDGPELDRIATRLRHDEPLDEPPADLDVTAVLEAVRKVPGVAHAQLRGAPGGMHTLRLDLADGADPGRVSRQVARLLKERMGLAAEPRRPRQDEPTRETPMTVRSGPRPATLTDVSGAPAPTTLDPRIAEPGSRVVVDQVRVSTLGSEATVEVRLVADGKPSVGAATGPAVDGYLLRLAASAAASAIDGLIESASKKQMVRCFIDHAGVVPFGSVNVAVVVVLVSGAGWVEQLVGSALVGGDPRQAIVRATLAAMNRRLETLLS